jgi:tetratricopeptide (TPR) repeat protein
MRPISFLARFLTGLVCLVPLAATPALPGQQAEMPISTSSKEALASFQKARDLAENVEFSAATPLLESAIAKDPNFALAYMFLANAGGGFAAFQKNAGAAVALVDKVSPGERLMLLSLKAQVDNDQTARRENAEALVKMFPKDKHAHFFAGQVARANGDINGALAHYEHAVALDKKFAAAYNMLGYTHIAMNNKRSAEADFKSYIKLRPDNPNPYDSYGELLQKMGRFDESTVQYQKALAKDPTFNSSMIRIGDNSLFKGDAAAAREWYRKAHDAARNDGDRVAALNATRDSYVAEGKTAEAMAANDELRSLAEKAGMTPAALGAHMAAGFIQLEAGNAAEAKKHLEAARQMNEASTLSPSAKDGNRVNIALAMSRVLSREGDTTGAAAQVGTARGLVDVRKIQAEQRAVEEASAFLALDQKQYETALQHFAKGDPDDGYVMYYTAVAYEGKGDRPAAKRMYTNSAGWNVPNLGYVMVRADAVKKAAAAAPK